jgi:hypothetical protein
MRRLEQKPLRGFRPDESIFEEFESLMGLGVSYGQIVEALILHYNESTPEKRREIENRLLQWRAENGVVVKKGRPSQTKIAPDKSEKPKHLTGEIEKIPVASGSTRPRK